MMKDTKADKRVSDEKQLEFFFGDVIDISVGMTHGVTHFEVGRVS